MNLGPTLFTVWEAFKATCRGWVISYATAEKHKRAEKKLQLSDQLRRLEERHMSDPSNLDLKKSLMTTRSDLQRTLHEQAAYTLGR